MKKNSFGSEMIPLQEFAHLLGYSNWFDERMWKEHGPFMTHFGQDDWIEKDLAHFYITSRGLGTFLKPHAPSHFVPFVCCESANKDVCRTNSMQNKLLKSISRISNYCSPVPESLIWHDIFIQLDSCQLKNYLDFNYHLFDLKQRGLIEVTRNEDGNPMYSISEVPKKRGPGRPRKYS
jgi:hypothetical protein